MRRTLPLVLTATFALAAAAPSRARLAPDTPAAKALRDAADYSSGRRGHAMLVWRGDSLVFEEYHNGWRRDRPHYLASGSKSFAGIMAAAAADDGLLSLDEPVSATIGEWKQDARKSRITIRQLIGLTSGIDGENLGRTSRAVADAIALPARWEPGTTFRYAQEPFVVFHEVMRRKLASRREAPTAYLQRRVLDPLGIRVSRWVRGADGTPSLAGGAFMTAREWGTLGRMLAQDGQWRGRQVVSRARLAELVRGGDALPAYGVTFWLNAALPAGSISRDEHVPPTLRTSGDAILPGGPRDLFMAAGAGNQRLYVLPAQQLVVVRLGDNRGLGGRRAYSDAEFLGRLLAAH